MKLHRPRIAVINHTIGRPSEVWVERQCLSFSRIEPIMMGWSLHPSWQNTGGIKTYTIPGLFEPPRTFGRQVQAKLGMAASRRTTKTQQKFLQEALNRANVEGVLCHFAWTAMAVSQAVSGNIPLLWHIHGRDVSKLMEIRSYRAMLAQQLPSASALIAVGHHQVEKLAHLGLPETTEIIPCGAPFQTFSTFPVPERASGQPIRFISVGRLTPEKGTLKTLAAFEQLITEYPNAEWVCIGDGPEMGVLNERVKSGSARAKINLLGLQSPENIAYELSRAHVFLQHSLPFEGSVEGFGVSLTEAGASGLPLVVSHLGGILDQVKDGKNGFLFEPGDTNSQANIMLKVSRDENLRHRLGNNARVVSKTFDSALMSQKLEATIIDTIAHHKECE